MRKTVYILMMLTGIAAASDGPYIIGLPETAVVQDPNTSAQEPNVPVEIHAEGVIAVDVPVPVLSVMAAATEVPEFRYRLTYRQSELIDGDSWALYQQFLAVDPNHLEREPDAAFLREQLALASGKMNLEKLAAHFEACGEKLAMLEKAVRSRTVVWPRSEERRVGKECR